MLKRSRKKLRLLKTRRTRKAPRQKRYARARRPKRFRSDKPGLCVVENGTIVWTLPRKLRSPNQIKTGLARYGDTKGWEKAFIDALLTKSDMSIGAGMSRRLRLEVVRLTPKTEWFLDRTNLAFSVKGLEDALVRLGYFVDDNEAWLDGPYVSQAVSEDKKYWTIVRILEVPMNAS